MVVLGDSWGFILSLKVQVEENVGGVEGVSALFGVWLRILVSFYANDNQKATVQIPAIEYRGSSTTTTDSPWVHGSLR